MHVESGPGDASPLSAHDQLHTKARVTTLMKKRVRVLVSYGITVVVVGGGGSVFQKSWLRP